MGIRGPFGVNFDEAFPHGVGVVGAVSAQRDFDKSSGDNSVQQLDAATGKRIWRASTSKRRSLGELVGCRWPIECSRLCAQWRPARQVTTGCSSPNPAISSTPAH